MRSGSSHTVQGRVTRFVAAVATSAALIAAGAPVASAQDPKPGPGTYTMDQTLSDNAQLSTIAFDALGFLTGTLGSDSFFPPGKVADFWGFQTLRDNDPSEMGHNTDFLTKASLNMLSVLTPEQRAALRTLAASQVDEINQYAYDRFVLMTAFRRLLAGDLPPGSSGLDEAAVKAYSAELYRLDGTISLQRAAVMGPILASLTSTQRATLDGMVGTGMSSWPNATEPAEMRGLDHDTKVAVMTYAGDLFSWYAGDVTADVYFCPERQGTYFGSFYLKDAPAVGNPGYSIGTNITGDMGKELLAALTPQQASLITGLVSKQRGTLDDIVDVRRQVSTQLRKYRSGSAADLGTTQALMSRYGEDDGTLVYEYATAFAKVNSTLSDSQQAALLALRTKTLGSFTPAPAYLYASPIAAPTVRNTDFLFGTSTAAPTAMSVRLVSSQPTARRGLPVILSLRTTGASSGSRAVIYASTPGRAAKVVRRLVLSTPGVQKVRFVPQATTRLYATIRDSSTGTTVSSPSITITVQGA